MTTRESEVSLKCYLERDIFRDIIAIWRKNSVFPKRAIAFTKMPPVIIDIFHALLSALFLVDHALSKCIAFDHV